jgi:hypothetical protein
MAIFDLPARLLVAPEPRGGRQRLEMPTTPDIHSVLRSDHLSASDKPLDCAQKDTTQCIFSPFKRSTSGIQSTGR